MKISAANTLWGAPRIQGELGKLGIDMSERTVSRPVRRPRRPPLQTWRTFLTNHVLVLGSMDFFTVPTVTGRILFVFVVLLHRRRVVHFNVTEHPTAAWTAQQVVEAFPDDTAPGWLLCDRDAIYGEAFRQRVAGVGSGEVLSAPSSPWQNPYAERLIGSIKARRREPRGSTRRAAFAPSPGQPSCVLSRIAYASLRWRKTRQRRDACRELARVT
jgi:putative transposase